jgi:hypothetical protein
MMRLDTARADRAGKFLAQKAGLDTGNTLKDWSAESIGDKVLVTFKVIYQTTETELNEALNLPEES